MGAHCVGFSGRNGTARPQRALRTPAVETLRLPDCAAALLSQPESASLRGTGSARPTVGVRLGESLLTGCRTPWLWHSEALPQALSSLRSSVCTLRVVRRCGTVPLVMVHACPAGGPPAVVVTVPPAAALAMAPELPVGTKALDSYASTLARLL